MRALCASTRMAGKREGWWKNELQERFFYAFLVTGAGRPAASHRHPLHVATRHTHCRCENHGRSPDAKHRATDGILTGNTAPCSRTQTNARDRLAPLTNDHDAGKHGRQTGQRSATLAYNYPTSLPATTTRIRLLELMQTAQYIRGYGFER